MSNKISRQQENAIKKIWRGHEATFFLLVLAIVASFFLLVSGESPKKWIEKDIIIDDISIVNIYRGRYYEITADDGNRYSIAGTNKNAEHLIPGNTYHIIHSKSHWNRIQFMEDATAQYVDYQESLHLNRGISLAGGVGLSVSFTLLCLLLIKISVKIQKIRGKRKTNSRK